MNVAHRGADVAMTHQALDRVQVDTALQQMRCESVAQSMNSARLGDSGAPLRGVEHLLYCGVADRIGSAPVGEQPRVRLIQHPVATQLREQSGREQTVAVLAALALLDAQAHA